MKLKQISETKIAKIATLYFQKQLKQPKQANFNFKVAKIATLYFQKQPKQPHTETKKNQIQTETDFETKLKTEDNSYCNTLYRFRRTKLRQICNEAT